MALPKASQGLVEAIKPLQADLFVLRGQTRSKRKRKPLDWEIHVNPFGLAVAAVGGALTLAILQLRMSRAPVYLVEARKVDVVIPFDPKDPSPIQTAMAKALPSGYQWEVPSIDASAEYAMKNDLAMNLFRSGFLGVGPAIISKFGDFVLGQATKGADLAMPPYTVNNMALYGPGATEPYGIHVWGYCYKVTSSSSYTVAERKSLVSVV